jgi:hypothetical protein
MQNHWVVVSIFQGVLDDVRLFNEENLARSYAKKIKKFVGKEEDFDVSVFQRDIKMDDVLR